MLYVVGPDRVLKWYIRERARNVFSKDKVENLRNRIDMQMGCNLGSEVIAI
jgi:hypothetical protein